MAKKAEIVLLILVLISIYILVKESDRDPFLGTYSELKVGMTLPDVQALVTRNCPGCTLENMQIEDHGHGNHPGLEVFNLYFGIDPVKFIYEEKPIMVHRIFLRIDFDKSNLKLVNAVYCRYLDPSQLKENLNDALSDRRALVGTGYYDH